MQDQEETFLCFWEVPVASPSACSRPPTLLYAVKESTVGKMYGTTKRACVSEADEALNFSWRYQRFRTMTQEKSPAVLLQKFPFALAWFLHLAGITSSVLPRPQIRAKTATKKNNPWLRLHKGWAVFWGPCWKGHRCHLQTCSQLEGGCFG